MNVLRFLILIALQVLIFNHIYLGGFINPLFYVYFILLLPFSTPKWLLLLASFAMGLGVDLFTYTLGLNAAACVLMAFMRPFVINRLSSGPESLIGETPSMKGQGVRWFMYYSVILVVVHHSALFYLEVFRLTEFFATLLRVLFSSAFTLILIVISENLFYSREK